MFLHQSRCRISPYYLNIISHKVSYILESLVYKETHECTRQWQGRIQGGGPGGPGPPLSESLGIDFYSGYRKKIQVHTFILL